MKNIFIKNGAVLVCLIIVLVFSSCDRNANIIEPTSTVTTTNNEITETTYDNISESIERTQNEDIGGGELGLLKYRMNYYDIPAPFAEIVESNMFEEWYSEVILENPNETNVMVMKRFINHFNVSREDFEKANFKWAKIIAEEMDGDPVMNPKDFANQELEEIYNVDILYTLDDEIINNYYLSHSYPFVYADEYENAVAKGEYISQTKDWIDIAQMEADIIAKYGEAEIVTEAETTVEGETESAEATEEIVQTDLVQTETNE